MESMKCIKAGQVYCGYLFWPKRELVKCIVYNQFYGLELRVLGFSLHLLYFIGAQCHGTRFKGLD